MEWLDWAQVVAAAIVGSGIGNAVSSYFAQLGKNLATKQDIEGITRILEGVRAEFAEQREQQRQQNRLLLQRQSFRHKMRIAAIERRLQAHQEAYAMWWSLLGRVHDRTQLGQAVLECQEWFVRNSLYLSPESGNAFSASYHAAANHPGYLETRADTKIITENWETIRRAGTVLVRAVSLPSIAEDEGPGPPSQ